jgi:LPXTG-site transpeptidase (sortase) family protein
MVRGHGSTGMSRIMVLLVALLAFGAALPAVAIAQEPVSPRELGELPTTGGARPGPMGLMPGSIRSGVLPVAIRIEAVDIEAPVEQQEIIDGVMQNPSGPFVVSWYRETGRLGEPKNNIVMAGHLDYWDVGEAIFYNVWQLEEGQVIQVLGQNDEVYEYEVNWVRNFTVNDLTPETIQEEIVGPTNVESVTLITCGGPFDYEAGEYEERIVIRATRVMSDTA